MDKREWATLILRVVLGVIFMLHGSQKLFGVFPPGFPVPALAAFFTKIGIHPGLFWAWVVAIVEFLGGSFLIFGFLTRYVAALLVIDMIVAVLKVNLWNGFFWLRPGGGWEFPFTLGIIALVLVLSGSGGLSVDQAIGFEKRKT